MISDADIDEAVHSATFDAWRRLDTFDSRKGTLRAWFFVIAKNACLQTLRARRRRRWQQGSDALERMPDPAVDRSSSTDQESQPSPFLIALRECVANLPRVQKAVIEADLRSGDVANAGDLANELNTSKNSIYVSRNGARRALRLALAKRGFELPSDGLPTPPLEQRPESKRQHTQEDSDGAQ